MSASVGPPQEFDLRLINQKLYSTRRPGRYLGLGAAVGIALIATIVTVARFGQILDGIVGLTQPAVLYLIVLGFTFAAVALTGSLYFALAPGGYLLRLGGEGLTITYPDGKQLHVRWTDPKLRLRLMDFSSHALEVADYGSPYFLERRGGRWTALSQKAFELILSEAYAHNLDVTSFLGFGGYGIAPLIRYIHPQGTRVRIWMGKPLQPRSS